MRSAIIFIYCLTSAVLIACSTGAATNPLVQAGPRYVIAADGTGTAQGFIGVFPVTARFRFSGNGVVTASPVPPYLFFNGDSDFMVEPFQGDESVALENMSSGYVQIQRGGQSSSTMQPPGTIASTRAEPALSPSQNEMPPAGR